MKKIILILIVSLISSLSALEIVEKVDGVEISGYKVDSLDDVEIHEGIEYYVDGVLSETLNNKAKDFEQQFDPLLKAFASVVLDEINLLRARAGLAERTIAQLKTAVKNKL